MVAALDDMQRDWRRQAAECLPQQLQIAERVARAAKEEHRHTDAAEVRDPQLIRLVRRVQRITQQDQTGDRLPHCGQVRGDAAAQRFAADHDAAGSDAFIVPDRAQHVAVTGFEHGWAIGSTPRLLRVGKIELHRHVPTTRQALMHRGQERTLHVVAGAVRQDDGRSITGDTRLRTGDNGRYGLAAIDCDLALLEAVHSRE